MRRLAVLLVGLVLLQGCVVPKGLFIPSASQLSVRSLQSKEFEVKKVNSVLSAGVSVLQDMGYTLKESSSELGFLTATKDASAVSAGQVALAVLAALGGTQSAIDKTQSIQVTLVLLGQSNSHRVTARTTFQRVVTRTDNSQYAETISDKKVYEDFYDKLGKALFLEENGL